VKLIGTIPVKGKKRFICRVGYKRVGLNPTNSFWKGEYNIYDRDLKQFVDSKGNIITNLTTKKQGAILSNGEISIEKLKGIIDHMNEMEKVYVNGFESLMNSKFWRGG
jgi:sugar phosphate isomerase/epimerase